VFIDGRPLGTTPLFGVVVEPGPHRLRFVNEPLRATQERSIVVEPSESRNLVADLRAAAPAGSDVPTPASGE
jgi:hypothetical protein